MLYSLMGSDMRRVKLGTHLKRQILHTRLFREHTSFFLLVILKCLIFGKLSFINDNVTIAVMANMSVKIYSM